MDKGVITVATELKLHFGWPPVAGLQEVVEGLTDSVDIGDDVADVDSGNEVRNELTEEQLETGAD